MSMTMQPPQRRVPKRVIRHWDPVGADIASLAPPTLKPVPGVKVVGEPVRHPYKFVNMSPERYLEEAFARPFPFAALPVPGEPVPDYAAEFIRDFAYALRIIRRARPDLWRTYSHRLHQMQGKRDVPRTIDDPQTGLWTPNDTESFGREPHEIRRDRKDPIAALYSEKYGWVWPAYYGAVDTTALIAMNDLEIARDLSVDYLFQTVDVEHNDGSREELPVFELLANNVHYLMNEVTVSNENPLGLVVTEMMSNYTWGSWDDSSDMPRAKNGVLPTGKLAHFEVNAYAVSVFRKMAQLVLRPDTFGSDEDHAIEASNLLRSLGIDEASAVAMLEAAGRIETHLVTTFVATQDGIGEYFVNALDIHGAGDVRQMDVITTKPLLVLDAGDVLEDPWSEYVLFRMGFDPAFGIADKFGSNNLSKLDPFFGAKTYHHAHWPHIDGIKAEGAIRRGAFALGSEAHAANASNFVYPTVGGYPEFTDISGEVPMPVLDDVMTTVEFPDGRVRPEVVAAEKHNESMQLWALAAYVAGEYASGVRVSGNELHATRVALYPDDGSYAYSLAQLEQSLLRAQNAAFDGLHISDGLVPATELVGQRRPGSHHLGRGGVGENSVLGIG